MTLKLRSMMIGAAAALLLIPTISAASGEDVGHRGWGPRFGVTSGPDQVHFGLHTDFGNFSDHVRFQPNFELGVGDDRTVGALNFEAAYRFSESYTSWSPYVGGGLGVNFVSSDRGFRDGTNTDAGLNALVGIEKGLASGDRFFTETKFGLTDSPDFKLTFGWTFYH